MSAQWRRWVYDKIRLWGPLFPLLPQDQIFAAGSLQVPPADRPFMHIRFEDTTPGLIPEVSLTRLSLWVHDAPGSYLGIETILREARTALVGADAQVGQVRDLASGVAVVWQGESGDLSNPDYGTILRFSSYDLHGKDGIT